MENAGAKFRELSLPWATFDRPAAVPLPPSSLAVAPPAAEIAIPSRPVAVSIDDAFGEMGDASFFAGGREEGGDALSPPAMAMEFGAGELADADVASAPRAAALSIDDAFGMVDAASSVSVASTGGDGGDDDDDDEEWGEFDGEDCARRRRRRRSCRSALNGALR